MRSPLPARLVLIVALIAGLIPALALPMRPSPVAAAPAAQTNNCVAGTDLVQNGSFERPGIGDAEEFLHYQATGWTRATWGYSASSDRAVNAYQIPVDGNVAIDLFEDSVAQTIDVSRYAGTLLTLSMVVSRRTFTPVVTFAGQPVPLTVAGSAASASIRVPPGATGRVTLSIGRGTNGTGSGAVIDNVRLVTDCQQVPNAAPVFGPGADTDQTLEATGPTGASGYAVPTATDTDAVTSANPRGTVTVTCTPAPTADVAVGTTRSVTCTATDTVPANADTLAAPVTVTFDVTVTDTTNPVLDETSLPGVIVDGARVLSATATGVTTAVTWDPITADDLVDGDLTLLCTPTSGTAFALGDTPVTCSVSDRAGNEVTTAFTVRVTDESDPVVTFVSPPTTVEATGPDGAPVTFTVTATDAVDGTLLPICSTGNPSQASSSGTTLPIGTHIVTCTAEDTVGNTGEASFTVTVQDTTDPEITVPSVARVVADGPTGAVVTFAPPTATDAVTADLTVTCDYETGDRFPIGVTVVSCTTEDGAGNEAEATFTVSVTSAANAVPTFSTGAGEDQALEATGPNGAAGAVIPVATDADASAPLTVSCVAGGQPVTATTVLPIATTIVTCTAADVVPEGAYQLPDATVTFDVIVRDTSAPVLDQTSLPGIVVGGKRVLAVPATGPTTAVTWDPISADDLVDGGLTLLCTPTSGTAFALGDTIVTCLTEDDAGNEVTTTFTVRVTDEGGPVVTITTSPTTVEATGPDGAPVAFTVTATDIVDGALAPVCATGTPSRTFTSGSSLALGTHTVTCTATDDAGNTGEASFTVTVRDTTVPVLDVTTVPGTGTPRVLTVAATGAFTTVRWDPSTAADAVAGTVILDCRKDGDGNPATLPTGDVIGTSGMAFPVGDTLVTCVGKDGSDNTVTTSFTVRVVDTTAPVVTVPANITVEATSGAGAVVTYTATATDLVDGTVTPVCSPASGSTFPIGTTTVSCSATDSRGNTSAAKTFTVTVRDTTGPVITWVGGPQPGKTYTQATLPAEPTCTATDTSSPVVQCRVYGYSTAPGTYTLTARARDAEGNSSIATRTYTVTASAPTATPRPVTATPRPATATPRPATATPRPATATPTLPVRPTTTPIVPTATPLTPTATPVTPVVQPSTAPTRPPRR